MELEIDSQTIAESVATEALLDEVSVEPLDPRAAYSALLAKEAAGDKAAIRALQLLAYEGAMNCMWSRVSRSRVTAAAHGLLIEVYHHRNAPPENEQPSRRQFEVLVLSGIAARATRKPAFWWPGLKRIEQSGRLAGEG